MAKPKIYLYAEALMHIRQLTLHASLETDKNEHTKILISSDKHIITAIHDGESSSIYLPTQISGTADVTFPFDRKTEISARVQIDDAEQLKAGSDDLAGIEVPWCATDLSETTSARCKGCTSEILEGGKVITWKDLPSDHWADLMDVWFCHKPHNDHTPDHHAAEAKGFSAKSKITAQPRTGLVDAVSFMLHRDDCSSIQEQNFPHINGISLHCATCNAAIGSSQGDEGNFRLYKSRLALKTNQDQEAQEFPPSVFICSQLLSLIESSVTRKIVLHSETRGDTENGHAGLLLWIFNPDIYYSSSSRGPTVHRAMKVFYQPLLEIGKFLDEHSNTHEELIIPPEDLEDFRKTLHDSTTILPQSARSFQGWGVGLIDRWEKNATGASWMDQNPLNKKVDEGFETFKLPEGMQELYL